MDSLKRAAARGSLWEATIEEGRKTRPTLSGAEDVDVCIIGGGFTGLWTARELLVRDPSLNVLILEAQHCGFGASGRNGGWASALFATSDRVLERSHGPDAPLQMRLAMQDALSTLLAALDADGIDADQHKGGTITLARTKPQLARAVTDVAESTRCTGNREDLILLSEEEAKLRCAAEGVIGGTWTPHCAAIHPLKLVRGLARSVEARGGRIAEGTAALGIEPGSPRTKPIARTAFGDVTATVVVRATEAWTSQLEPTRRAIIPLYSLMLATQPLDAATWTSIGLRDRATFADYRHLIVYGQRTADGRLAFGGRGAPYHFGSRIAASFDRDLSIFTALHKALLELFPLLTPMDIDYAWGGPLGVARDWSSSVTFDQPSGLASAGGYVGDGVTTSHLAGKTLADLILGKDSPLTHLPWVGHHSPRWEPEPLRWLGVNAGLAVAAFGDRSERITGRPSRVANTLHRLLG